MMDFLKAFAIHFVAFLSLFAGALNLITTFFGDIEYQWGGKSGSGWYSIYSSSGTNNRKLSIIGGVLSLAFGSVLL
jgi:hypothetical protein